MKLFPQDFHLNTRLVLINAASLIFLLAVVSLLLHLWENRFPILQPAEVKPSQSARQQVEFDSGRLVQDLKAKQLEHLKQYHWTDADHQFAKVPIDRAIEFLSRDSGKAGSK